MSEKFNIFRIYQANHPESLDFKPPVRQSAPEINFAPKTVLEISTPTVSKPDSIVPLIDETAGQIDAQEEISRVTDINEMIRIGNFPAAEYLLGRKLTMDELREKMVRDLLKAPEKLEQQLRAEIMREKKKAEIQKKIQEEEAQKNALSNPGSIGPFGRPPGPPGPPPPPGPPSRAATPPPRVPTPPLRSPTPPPRVPTPPPVFTDAATQDYLDVMDDLGIDEVTAVQMLMTTTKALDAYLTQAGVSSVDLPMILMAHAMARYEQIEAPASSSVSGGPVVHKSVEDDSTQAIRAFQKKWKELKLDGTNLGYTLQEGLLAETDDFEKALQPLGLNQKDVATLLTMQQVLHAELGYGRRSAPVPSPPPPGGPAPAGPAPKGPPVAIQNAVFTMPPMTTDAEKEASAKMMQASFALTKDKKSGLSPQEVFKARQLYKQYISAVKADYETNIGKVKASMGDKKNWQKRFSGLTEIGNSKANKGDLSKALTKMDTDAADKLQEIVDYAAKNAIQLGTGLPVRKMRADWEKFGDRFLINMDKFKRGIFALGYATTRQPPQWARGGIELTRPLRNVIQAFLDGEPLDLSELNEQEKAWITHIWTNAKIVKGKVPSYGMMKTKQLRTKQDMIDRIDVLLGIQAAGNDSPLILKELNEIKEKMYDRGWISAADLKKLEQLIALGA